MAADLAGEKRLRFDVMVDYANKKADESMKLLDQILEADDKTF
jgi:hypothetical protein